MATPDLTQQPSPHTECDICRMPIEPGDRLINDGSEIAHADCVGQWFRSSFGRETLS